MVLNNCKINLFITSLTDFGVFAVSPGKDSITDVAVIGPSFATVSVVVALTASV